MDWFTYLLDGIRHITDFGGYDHMVYLIALVSIFEYDEVKRVLLLATAFTVGHSVTLILAGLNLVHVDPAWIEFLIPITILITGLTNLRYASRVKEPIPGHGWRYLFAIIFGLIHGLGFSSYFRMILDEGESIVSPLLLFNIGVEIGQLLIVVCFMFLAFVLQSSLKIRQRDWILFFAGLTSGIALLIAAEAWPL
jgi:uncharacterized membrane protein